LMILEARTCKSTLSAQLNAILGTRTYRSALSAQRESFLCQDGLRLRRMRT